jgi:hypothetical protein
MARLIRARRHPGKNAHRDCDGRSAQLPSPHPHSSRSPPHA